MTEKYPIPQKTDQLHRDFFARHAHIVAKDLLGRYLVIQRPDEKPIYAQLTEIAAYEGGAESSMTKGALYAPGTLIVSTKFGKRLIDIATREICIPSCITLRAGMVSDGMNTPELVNGPGKLAERLNINREYDGLPIDAAYVWLGGESVDATEMKERKSRNAPDNWKGTFYMSL